MIRTTTRSLALATAIGLTFAASASASVFSVSGPGGAIPDTPPGPGTWNVAYTGTPFTSTVTLTRAVTSISKVRLSGFNHTWRGDLHIILKSPTAAFNIVVRPGSSGVSVGDSGDYLNGVYDFVESGGGTVAQGALNIGGGLYNQFFNVGTGQWTNGISNTGLSGITGGAGVWTLEIRDWASLDIGSLTGWTLEGNDVSGGGPFTNFCGNGQTATPPCPCGQLGIAGNGCNNSDNTGGANLTATGTTSPDTVVLTMTNGPVAPQPVIFFQGDATVAFAPFGDGVRCVGGNLFRLYIKTSAGGSASAPVGLDPSITAASAAAGDTIPPGALRYYQAYYRDGAATFCTARTFNSTNAVAIQW